MKNRTRLLILSIITAVVVLLASCGPSTTPPAEEKPTPTTPTTQAPTPTTPKEEKPPAVTTDAPTYGGRFNMGWSRAPYHFDEVRIGSPYWTTTFIQTNEGLLEGDWAKGPAGSGESGFLYQMMPEPKLQRGLLAESWEMPDANTLVYHIRKGVRWHNKPPANGRK